MKKFVAMICAIVLAVSLAVPAMALEKSPRIKDITAEKGAEIPANYVPVVMEPDVVKLEIAKYDSILPDVDITRDARAKEIGAMTIDEAGAYRFWVKLLIGEKPEKLYQYVLVISDSVKEYYSPNDVIACYPLDQYSVYFHSEDGEISVCFPAYLFEGRSVIVFDLLQNLNA